MRYLKSFLVLTVMLYTSVVSAFDLGYQPQTFFTNLYAEAYEPNVEEFTKYETRVTLKNDWPDGWGFFAHHAFFFGTYNSNKNVDSKVFGYMGLVKGGYLMNAIRWPSPENMKIALFSIWDQSNIDGTWGPNSAKAVPASSNCARFGNEGVGTTCRIEYKWKAGTEYRLFVKKTQTTSTYDRWGAWVTDMRTMEMTYIGEIDLERKNGFSYGGIKRRGHYHVSEYYYSASENITCKDLPRVDVEWMGPFVEDKNYKPLVDYHPAYTNHNVGAPTEIVGNYHVKDCMNTNVRPNGPYSIIQENGKGVIRTNNYDYPIFGETQRDLYNKIDCTFDMADKLIPDLFKNTDPRGKRLTKSNAEGNRFQRDYSTWSYDKNGRTTFVEGFTITATPFTKGNNLVGVVYTWVNGRIQSDTFDLGNIYDYIDAFGCNQ